jgi:hypothetical protein
MHIISADIHLIDLQTRFPFKYGIATMTRAPYAMVRVHVESGGHTAVGTSADLLPPKWFTKIAEKPPDEEVDEMATVVEHAVELAVGMRGETAFDLWREIGRQQTDWGTEQRMPPLLSGFGTSLVERAIIEATCRLHSVSFATAVRGNVLGIRLGEVDEELQSFQPRDLLPSDPRGSIVARHTIGMADLLTADEISEADRLDDGLPQSLDECIQRYCLRHFKIKVSGNIDSDVDRVGRIADVIGRLVPPDFAVTMDGNEQFRSLEAFREYWQTLTSVPALGELFGRLMFVEQPFHRDVALDGDVLDGLSHWSDRPPMIIDESDAESGSMRRALSLGYNGTSHKNCKGVFKSVINACLLEKRRRENPAAKLILSGEDLANVGPVALLQDLAVAATLGVESVERNGHHYFAGLSAFPQTVQQQMLGMHCDLYHDSAAGWPTLSIERGELQLSTVNAAPFGVGFELDVELFSSIATWKGKHRD